MLSILCSKDLVWSSKLLPYDCLKIWQFLPEIPYRINNCYAIKVVFQTSVCVCAWFCLRLQDAIVNNVNYINIAKLLFTIYCKCQKILWWKLDASVDAEVSEYGACNFVCTVCWLDCSNFWSQMVSISIRPENTT